MEKVCIICQTSKPLTLFHKNRGMRKDGHVNQCIPCLKEQRNQKGDWLRMRYGILPEQKARMVAEQGGRCKICLVPKKKLCVDHCHRTGRIRGLLCNQCNVAIAFMGENETNMRRMIEYLKPPGDSTAAIFVNTDRYRKRQRSVKRWGEVVTS